MTDDPYVYPGTSIFRNKLGIKDPDELDRVERLLARQRASEGIPSGDFGLAHLQAIHGHIFQDVYDWAGEVRTVEVTKGGHQFMFRQYIENGMSDVHRRIVAADYFKSTTLADFADAAGPIMGDVNYVHPFREGNGRAQLLYLKQLSANAGHALDLREIDRAPWLHASRSAHDADYAPMGQVIRTALERSATPAQSAHKVAASEYLRERGRSRDPERDR